MVGTFVNGENTRLLVLDSELTKSMRESESDPELHHYDCCECENRSTSSWKVKDSLDEDSLDDTYFFTCTDCASAYLLSIDDNKQMRFILEDMRYETESVDVFIERKLRDDSAVVSTPPEGTTILRLDTVLTSCIRDGKGSYPCSFCISSEEEKEEEEASSCWIRRRNMQVFGVLMQEDRISLCDACLRSSYESKDDRTGANSIHIEGYNAQTESLTNQFIPRLIREHHAILAIAVLCLHCAWHLWRNTTTSGTITSRDKAFMKTEAGKALYWVS